MCKKKIAAVVYVSIHVSLLRLVVCSAVALSLSKEAANIAVDEEAEEDCAADGARPGSSPGSPGVRSGELRTEESVETIAPMLPVSH